ncbi:hypothetical protein LEN26_015613 [Aphanomyces euteiches]|nr:hypothetical protein LEN26_015613 [Aphanomyces euteiches]KAH9128954.1 hypothetical protein AeMF1_000956 [Aphanomyces euteiches]KAH9194935.1 hypothetical protein AeNC1_003077 [Aphanomyces euteiches]
MDLRQDGHFHHIQAFEHKRKQAEDKELEENGESSGDKSPRPRGRPPSKSPSRGRSRSVSKDPNAPKKPRSTSRKPKEGKDVKIIGSPEVFKNSTEAKPVDLTASTERTKVDEIQADDESESQVFNSPCTVTPADVDNNVVSQVVHNWSQQGWLLQGTGILVVFFAMLGNILVPNIEQNVPMSPQVKTVLAILTKTNSLPPLISLALVLWGKNNRGLSKWVAICLVWRTAAEVILQLPDPKSLYFSVSIICVFVADAAALIAVTSAVGGSHPEYDVFTQTLCVFGFGLLLFSDSLLGPLLDVLVGFQSVRVVVMSMASIFLSMSSMLAEV